MLRYAYIAWFVMTEAECIYCMARQKSLNKIQVNISIYRTDGLPTAQDWPT